MGLRVALIGFGEAGRAFAGAAGWRGDAFIFDRKTASADAEEAREIHAACIEHGVVNCATLSDTLANAQVVLALVTADQSLAAARAAAPHLRSGARFFDMNSVAPDTKRAARDAIETAGGRYVDVAIMTPVQPAAMAAPLYLSGADIETAAGYLRDLGFRNVRVVGAEVGRASTIKMVRSVMVKGIEALTAECMMAASAGSVVPEILESLGGDWLERANYNLDRMIVHGVRRAAEMREVAATLESLGVDPLMTRSTAERQAAAGKLGLERPPLSLTDKLAVLASHRRGAAQ